MKKLFAILLCFIMIFSLFACGAKVKTVEDYLKDKENQVLNQEQTQDDIIEI